MMWTCNALLIQGAIIDTSMLSLTEGNCGFRKITIVCNNDNHAIWCICFVFSLNSFSLSWFTLISCIPLILHILIIVLTHILFLVLNASLIYKLFNNSNNIKWFQVRFAFSCIVMFNDFIVLPCLFHQKNICIKYSRFWLVYNSDLYLYD